MSSDQYFHFGNIDGNNQIANGEELYVVWTRNAFRFIKSFWLRRFSKKDFPHEQSRFARDTAKVERIRATRRFERSHVLGHHHSCLLYTSDAADEEDSVDLGGRRIIKKKKK